MNYFEKHNSFEKGDDNKEIDISIFEALNYGNCEIGIKFFKKSFNNKQCMEDFYTTLEDYQERYIPKMAKVEKTEDYINLQVDFEFKREKDIESQEELIKLNSLKLLLNCIINQKYPKNKIEWIIVDGENEKENMNTIHELINEFLKSNPELVYTSKLEDEIESDIRKYDYRLDEEIESYLPSEKQREFQEFEKTHMATLEKYFDAREDYENRLLDHLNKDQMEDYYKLAEEYDAFLKKNSFSLNEENKLPTYEEAFLNWVGIRVNQKNLLDYISNDEIDKISENHYKGLPRELKDLLNVYITLPKNKRELEKEKIFSVISKNLLNLIASQEEIERDEYLK